MSADQTRIIARLELGMSLSEAAEAVGINSATARGWLFRGVRQPEGAHGGFAVGVEAARSNPRGSTDLAQLVRAGSVRAARQHWRQVRERQP